MRLANYLEPGPPPQGPGPPDTRILGVLKGVGIGPDVIDASLQALEAVSRVTGLRFEVREGGPIGEEALAHYGTPLPGETAAFCEEVFAAGGAILSGPAGGRYVYDLRRRFDLFCKFVPEKPVPALARIGCLRPEHLDVVDILIVRDNIGGVYQGEWSEDTAHGRRVARHAFAYHEADVLRLATVAARAAADRRGALTVVVKDGGIPTISNLWRDVAGAAAARHGVAARFLNVDAIAYELIQHPRRFDVIVAPNLFGDVVADLAGLLVGSRGITFSGNFDPYGHGVFQTNHGCAKDLAGTDTANPAGQIFSLAMLLHEAFDLPEAAALVEGAVEDVWRDGWRTADVAEPGCRVVGTREMAGMVAKRIAESAALAAT